MELPPPREVLTDIEQALGRATMRLGRLRGRQRGSGIHRDLSAIFYDVQAARHDVALLLEEQARPDGNAPSSS